jgi:hypothetical protein
MKQVPSVREQWMEQPTSDLPDSRFMFQEPRLRPLFKVNHADH